MCVYQDRAALLSVLSSVHSFDCLLQSVSHWPAGLHHCTTTPSAVIHKIDHQWFINVYSITARHIQIKHYFSSCNMAAYTVYKNIIKHLHQLHSHIFTFPWVILERQATWPAIAPPYKNTAVKFINKILSLFSSETPFEIAYNVCIYRLTFAFLG